MKKKNNTSTEKKLKDIYSFLDDKEKPKSEELLQYFKEEKDTIKKDDIVKEEIKDEIKVIPIEQVTKEKYSSSTIDDDIKNDGTTIVSEKNHSDLMKAFESLSNPENMESNTILTNNQVIALSTINYLAQVYDIEFYKQFIKIFPRYRISGDDGRGRKELIEIANAIRRDKEEEHNRVMDLLGRR